MKLKPKQAKTIGAIIGSGDPAAVTLEQLEDGSVVVERKDAAAVQVGTRGAVKPATA